MLAPWKKSYDKPIQHIKKQRQYFSTKSLANKFPYGQCYGFSSSHVWIWELDHKESWAPKNWCFLNCGLKETLESPLDSKEIKPVNTKGNQSWIFIGRTDAEVEAPVLWPPDVKSQLTGKDPDAGKDWRQEERGTAEDRMAGWHHRLNGHEFEQVLGDGEGQGSLLCCSPWGCKESDMTEEWTKTMPDTKPQTQDNAKKLHLGISFSDYRKSKTKKKYCETSQREKTPYSRRHKEKTA